MVALIIDDQADIEAKIIAETVSMMLRYGTPDLSKWDAPDREYQLYLFRKFNLLRAAAQNPTNQNPRQ